MTKLCYYVTHFTNPGILPFNWSETKQRRYTKDELRSGIAITRDQKMWGKTHDWPSRSFFSGDYGAIVLRADHYCMWINHWVGLKNHKFFIQSLFYCSAFLIEYLFVLYKVFRNDAAIRKSPFFYFVLLACVTFGFFHTSSLYDQLSNVLKNITSYERMSDSGQFSLHDKGILKNFEEIFGSVFLLPFWFLPISTPLPVDGFNYPLKKDDVCLASNRSQCYAYIPASFYRKICFYRIFGRFCD